MNTTEEIKTKVETLESLGYNKKFLELCQEEEFSHIRWSLDDLLFLESLKGKTYTHNSFTGITERVSPTVGGCAIFFKSFCITGVCKEKGKIVRRFPNGTFVPIEDLFKLNSN